MDSLEICFQALGDCLGISLRICQGKEMMVMKNLINLLHLCVFILILVSCQDADCRASNDMEMVNLNFKVRVHLFLKILIITA